jgi:hypothetical protein
MYVNFNFFLSKVCEWYSDQLDKNKDIAALQSTEFLSAG